MDGPAASSPRTATTKTNLVRIERTSTKPCPCYEEVHAMHPATAPAAAAICPVLYAQPRVFPNPCVARIGSRLAWAAPERPPRECRYDLRVAGTHPNSVHEISTLAAGSHRRDSPAP